MRKQMVMVANHFRALKKWLLTPKADTLDNFRAQVLSDLSLVASGNLDGLEKLPIDNATRHDVHKRALIAVIKTLLTGSLVAFFAWILHKIPFLHVPSAATLLGPAYILLAIINLLDPNIAAKIDIAKHLREITPEAAEKKSL